MTQKQNRIAPFATLAEALLTPSERVVFLKALADIIEGKTGPGADTLPRVVKRGEVMAALGCSRTTVNNLARRGVLVRVRFGSGKKGFGYTAESVQELLTGKGAK